MKTTKRTAWVGSLIFSLGMACGNVDSGSAVGATSLAVTGSDISGEQLALPDGDGPCAKDGAGQVMPSELDHLTTLLGLIADQIAQLQPILDAMRTALESVRAQVKAGTLSPADARAQVRELHEQQKAQILALLTPAQQAKFTQMRDHHCGPFDIARLTAALGLSADQASQLSSLMSAAQAQVNDLHAQVEAGTLALADAHVQIEQIHAATQAAIKDVLTAEQQALLAKLMESGRPSGPMPVRK